MNEIACDNCDSEFTESDMTFGEALKILNIEDYSNRIVKSSSRGELFHLADYIGIAILIKDNPVWFRHWFEEIVKVAEKKWERPESIFQHIPAVLTQFLDNI